MPIDDDIEVNEEWARSAEPGPELDRVCAEWMGWKPASYRGSKVGWYDGETGTIGGLPKYSTDWSAAGPLLEATGCPDVRFFRDEVEITVFTIDGGLLEVLAPTPQLAIARACAVLSARVISRDELEN